MKMLALAQSAGLWSGRTSSAARRRITLLLCRCVGPTRGKTRGKNGARTARRVDTLHGRSAKKGIPA